MARWLEDIQTAFTNLGGVSQYAGLYDELEKLRGRQLSIRDQATIRKEIQRSSSSSKVWEKKRDLFYSVEGIGSGVWGLRAIDRPTPLANDIDDESIGTGTNVPERASQTTFRILRETSLARRLKRLHRYKCQICGAVIQLANGSYYAEAHHMQPLGRPHNGPDIPGNIIVVCPTCHVKLDYFAIELVLSDIRDDAAHDLHPDYIEYHNQQHLQAKNTR